MNANIKTTTALTRSDVNMIFRLSKRSTMTPAKTEERIIDVAARVITFATEMADPVKSVMNQTREILKMELPNWETPCPTQSMAKSRLRNRERYFERIIK